MATKLFHGLVLDPSLSPVSHFSHPVVNVSVWIFANLLMAMVPEKFNSLVYSKRKNLKM